LKLNLLNILVAEDDPNDVALLKMALARVNSGHAVFFVSDGCEAINYLRGDGPYADRSKYPFPNVLITDLKMPRCSGLDLLKWLHDHEECGVIPTIVLSNSTLADDIKKSYQLKANTFFKKPADFDGLMNLLRMILGYWFEAHVPEPPPQYKCL
jgi:CheY-like chemotaxis protein